MRTRSGILTAAITLVALATAAFAFPSGQPNALGLTPAQKDKIIAINRKARAEISAAQFGMGKPAEKRARIEKLRQKYDAAAMAVLNPKQRAKVAADQQEIKRKMAQILAVQKTLTPDQRSRAQRIRADYSARAQRIFANKKISDTEKRVQYVALQKQMKTALESILTSKQRAALPK